jgi:hypothetical protein
MPQALAVNAQIGVNESQHDFTSNKVVMQLNRA